MLNFLQLFQLISGIVQTVQTIETVLPNSPGKEKLKAATATVMSTMNGATQVMPQVEGVINAVVALCNAAKIFKKK